MSKQQQPPVYPDEPKIPILPNMLTAGNLLCGFFAILTIFRGMHTPGEAFACYQQATYLIFARILYFYMQYNVVQNTTYKYDVTIRLHRKSSRTDDSRGGASIMPST